METTNLPLSTYTLQACGGWGNVKEKVKEVKLDGLEFIADPDNLPDDIPLSLVAGYHMTFYVDWLDFWRQDEKALMRKFVSWETVKEVYHGTKTEYLLSHIHYPRVGIMVDTGHLMNTNWKIRSQWEGKMTISEAEAYRVRMSQSQEPTGN